MISNAFQRYIFYIIKPYTKKYLIENYLILKFQKILLLKLNIFKIFYLAKNIIFY